MLTNYDAPPRQPKWLLHIQMFLLRHRLMGPFNRQFLIITTTGRKTGQKRSVPIGFIPDGDTYLVLNLGGVSNWYKNALTDPRVTLIVEGKQMNMCAEAVPVKTPEQLMPVLAAYRRERPNLFKNVFGMPPDAPQDELMKIGERVAFMRFYPVPGKSGQNGSTTQGNGKDKP